MDKIIEGSSTVDFLNQLAKFDFCENPYQSYAFYSVYLSFKKNQCYRFFYIYDETDKLVGIAPFSSYKTSLGTELLSFVGQGHFNYEQYICRDDDTGYVHKSLMCYLSKGKRPVIIDYFDVNSESHLYNLLQKEVNPKTVIPLYGCPLVNLNYGSFDDFFKAAVKEAKKRTEIRKFQRKLDSLGDLEIYNIRDTESYTRYQSYIPEMYRVFEERFKGVYATSFFSEQSQRQYYNCLINSLMKSKKGFISLLTLDGALISFIFCLAAPRTLIDWIPAFDPAFSKYNVGTVHYKMLFEEIIANRDFDFFDFSKGSTVYKKRWSDQETVNYQVIINLTQKNWGGSIVYSLYKAYYITKTWMRNKGINSKLKFLLGRIRRGWVKPEKKKVLVVEGVKASSDAPPLSYSRIADFPCNVRKEILDKIYNGMVIEQLYTEGDSITVLMSR